MKRIEIAVEGQFEEEIALEILRGVYGAVQNNGYTDVSVNAVTEKADRREIQVPDFMTQQDKGEREARYTRQRRG